jgi:hypothetical protein
LGTFWIALSSFTSHPNHQRFDLRNNMDLTFAMSG